MPPEIRTALFILRAVVRHNVVGMRACGYAEAMKIVRFNNGVLLQSSRIRHPAARSNPGSARLHHDVAKLTRLGMTVPPCPRIMAAQSPINETSGTGRSR